MKEILTAQEVADHLRMKAPWVREQCDKENIPAFKLGKEWRIKREDLLTWIEEQGIELH